MQLESMSLQDRRARSVLLILVPEARPLIEAYRRIYTADGASVPPHITLLQPFLAPAELTADVRQRIAQAIATVPRFDFTLVVSLRMVVVVRLSGEVEVNLGQDAVWYIRFESISEGGKVRPYVRPEVEIGHVQQRDDHITDRCDVVAELARILARPMQDDRARRLQVTPEGRSHRFINGSHGPLPRSGLSDATPRVH